jgi:anti-sigma B factor antagonist
LVEVLETALSGVPLLKITGDIDHVTAPALEASIQQALGIDGAYLLLDLSDCPYLDSGGLSVLLFVCRQVRDEGWLGVIAPHPNLVRLFDIVGLSTARGFRIFSSSQEAVAALER